MKYSNIFFIVIIMLFTLLVGCTNNIDSSSTDDKYADSGISLSLPSEPYTEQNIHSMFKKMHQLGLIIRPPHSISLEANNYVVSLKNSPLIYKIDKYTGIINCVEGFDMLPACNVVFYAFFENKYYLFDVYGEINCTTHTENSNEDACPNKVTSNYMNLKRHMFISEEEFKQKVNFLKDLRYIRSNIAEIQTSGDQYVAVLENELKLYYDAATSIFYCRDFPDANNDICYKRFSAVINNTLITQSLENPVYLCYPEGSDYLFGTSDCSNRELTNKFIQQFDYFTNRFEDIVNLEG